MARLIMRFVALSVLIAGLSPACSDTGSGSSKVAAFDADLYRAEIEAIEAILYKDSPPTWSDPSFAGAALADLFEAIAKNETSVVKRQEAQRLLFLGSRADISDMGYAAPDLSGTRIEWERARFELFGEEDWFRTSSDELVASQTRTIPKPTAQQIFELTRMIDRLEDLIEYAGPECDDLGEPDYEPGYEGVEGRRQIEGWRRFSREWDGKLDYASSFMPVQPPFDGDTDFVMAYQSVGQALHELRILPMGVGDWPTPFAYQWEQRLQTAGQYLTDARERLEQLQ